MLEKNEVKFCICAMLDLLGFSNHLEISAYDLRTSIGKQAINRLETLESTLESLNSEKEKRQNYYPPDFHIQRINDAIFITMDLDDILIPSIGSTNFEGLTSADINEIFTKEQIETETGFLTAYSNKIYNAIEPLLKFVGFISRLHIYINKIEGQNFFPGVKTVVSTGFRRPFSSKIAHVEDFFSANFALSNAYLAEKSLHGPNFYLDNGIIQMISFNEYARNIMRFSHFQFNAISFNCFDDHEDVFSFSKEANIPNHIEIILFRKKYHFRHLNPSPLAYLQNLPSLIPYLTNNMEPNLSNIYYKHIYHAIKSGIQRKKDEALKPPLSFIFNGTYDLGLDVGIFIEFISTGKSQTREEFNKKQLLEKYSLQDRPEDDEYRKRMMELLEEKVDIDIYTIKIEENLNTIFNFSEETLTNLMIMLEGDIEILDYRCENENDTI